MIGLAAGLLSLTSFARGVEQDTPDPFAKFQRTDTQREIEVGRISYDRILQSGTISQNAQARERVQRVFANLIAAMPVREYPFQVVLLGTNEINAFCLPGGYIVFLEGLLSLMKTDEELAHILGHEIGHAVRKHWARDLRSDSINLTVDAMLGTNARFLKSLANSREHEREADDFGTRLYVAAGYPPARASDGMQIFQRLESGRSDTPYYLRTHPPSPERVGAIARLAGSLPAPARRSAAPVDAVALLGNVPEGTAPHALLPLEAERRWTYRVEAAGVRQEYTVEVVGLAQGETCRVARLRCDAGGDWISYQCATTGTALYRRDRPDREASKWKPVLSTAGGEIGGWSYDPPVEEATSVPAGDYPHAMKIVGRREGRETIWWLVDGIGIVRKEDRPAGGIGMTSEVLLSTSR